jgi:hypothetical protein
MARNGNTPTFLPDENDIKEVKILAGLGLTKYLIQNYFGHSKDVWLKAEKRTPDLRKAFNRGQAETIARVSNKLYDLIMAGNIQAIMFYLRTRAGWSEKYNPELDCNVTEPAISINVTDPIEAAKIYQQIMKGGSKK